MAMTLGDRLRQVVTGTRPVTADPDYDQRERALPRPRVDGWRIADVLAGQWVESAEGAVVVVDRYYAADRRHGRTPIGELVEILEGSQAELDVLKKARQKIPQQIEAADISLRVELMVLEPPARTPSNEKEFQKLPGFIGKLVEDGGIALGKLGIVLKPDVEFDFKKGQLKKFGIELKLKW